MPELISGTEDIFQSWWQFGMPAALAGGGMTMPHLEDRRAQLYMPRLAWLDEHGRTGSLRELYLAGWSSMDDLFVHGMAEQLEKAKK